MGCGLLVTLCVTAVLLHSLEPACVGDKLADRLKVPAPPAKKITRSDRNPRSGKHDDTGLVIDMMFVARWWKQYRFLLAGGREAPSSRIEWKKLNY